MNLKVEAAAGAKFPKGVRVIGRVKKNEWYTGTVSRSGASSITILFDDGYKAVVGEDEYKYVRKLKVDKVSKTHLTLVEMRALTTGSDAAADAAADAAVPDDGLIHIRHNRGPLTKGISAATALALFKKYFKRSKAGASSSYSKTIVHTAAVTVSDSPVRLRIAFTLPNPTYKSMDKHTAEYSLDVFVDVGTYALDTFRLSSQDEFIKLRRFKDDCGTWKSTYFTCTETDLEKALVEFASKAKTFKDMVAKFPADLYYDATADMEKLLKALKLFGGRYNSRVPQADPIAGTCTWSDSSWSSGYRDLKKDLNDAIAQLRLLKFKLLRGQTRASGTDSTTKVFENDNQRVSFTYTTNRLKKIDYLNTTVQITGRPSSKPNRKGKSK